MKTLRARSLWWKYLVYFC